ncbi:MAG: DUF4302 domain-containing protein [Bacteroidota bacterium]
MKRFQLLVIGFFSLWAFSCQEDDDDLPSTEVRVAEAIDNLRDELTDPVNGWRLDYQPTPDAGFFFILMDFDDNGLVTIKSDVAANDGEFFEQTIPYRIDNALGLELIFETYAVFHYLFELDQASFGAEFEFIFNEKEGNNLVFDSKSDVINRSRLTFVPANGGEEGSFSREISANLEAFDSFAPQIFGGEPPIQQLYLSDQNISVFWSIDITKRTIFVDQAGVGASAEEIVASGNSIDINHFTPYILLDGKLVLIEPFSFSLDGQQITVSEVTLNELTMDGPSFCSLNAIATPVYSGSISGQGDINLQQSLFTSNGLGFQPKSTSPYSVNIIFIFDDDARSLAEEGSIFEFFPEFTGFVFNYGLDSDEQPANAAGFQFENSAGELVTFLREFEATTTGNRLQISFTDDFFFSEMPNAEEEQNLRAVMDEIFEGGEIYLYDLPQTGIKVFRLYNPCNQYEAFLVQ